MALVTLNPGKQADPNQRGRRPTQQIPMTASNRQRVGELVRWTARLWSLPLIAVTFLLAAGPFVPLPFNIAGRLFIGALSSLYAMGFAVAFVVAWRYESVGGWIALGSAVAFKVGFTIRWGHPPVSPFDLLLWLPAILFLLSSFLHGAIGKAQTPELGVGGGSAAQTKPRRLFALPRTSLGWWSLLIGTGFFLCMRLFWMQAGTPGRNRSTFFSDPIDACCLIGALGLPIVGMVVALVAIIWKRERSLLLVPLLLLGLYALVWAVAILSGANA